MLVKCLNCGLIWRYVNATGPGTVAYEDIQTCCPACQSNAYRALLEQEKEMP